jgi:hypothetical protein
MFAPGLVRAEELIVLGDDFGFATSIADVAKDSRVIKMREEVAKVAKSIEALKEPEIVKLLGKSIKMPENRLALSVGQDPILTLSGRRYRNPAQNKDHIDFYALGDYAGVEVYYDIDGRTPAAVVVYFAVDREFVRISKENLAKRLDWEKARLERLAKLINEKGRNDR